jgi:cyclophilin family peptidyl-prolyl cis-trans isomerase
MGLPRYSTARYLAIWVPLIIVILGVILLMVYLNQGSSQPTAGALPKFMIVETTRGTFKIQLDGDAGMQNVTKNFADKARAGTFDGRTFHRVEDWVIQGGDPQGNGSGGGDIVAQYNQKPFKRGAVGVASTGGGGPRINDSQWFVVKKDSDFLNGQYANFGQVVEGMEVVDQIQIGDKMTKVTVSDQ